MGRCGNDMKKPRYTEDMFKIIFFWLGTGFIFTGLLSFAGILWPTESSMVQNSRLMGIIFSSLGIAFLVVYAVCKALGCMKWKLHCELLEHGDRVKGTVEKVYLQSYTQYGRQYPYRILYTYSSQGNVYHHKSCLLWEIPDCSEHDTITVYINDRGESAIDV